MGGLKIRLSKEGGRKSGSTGEVESNSIIM